MAVFPLVNQWTLVLHLGLENAPTRQLTVLVTPTPLLRRGGGPHRWHLLVKCKHGDLIPNCAVTSTARQRILYRYTDELVEAIRYAILPRTGSHLAEMTLHYLHTLCRRWFS
eukprot:COSAG01_NODE_3921_length_5535_cov_44.878933_8_plen_112_part_00